MSNISFRFKRISDQTEVSADEVDRQVCQAFGLTYGNLNDSGHPDYGHFPLDPSTYGQDYISWYGFISVILWWGDRKTVSFWQPDCSSSSTNKAFILTYPGSSSLSDIS